VSSTSAQNATVTSPSLSTTSATLLAAGGARKAWYVVNNTAAVMYLRFGSGAASSTDFTAQVAAGGAWECPQPVYSGQVTAILASGTGNAQVTAW
jgi:hypothetical protein